MADITPELARQLESGGEVTAVVSLGALREQADRDAHAAALSTVRPVDYPSRVEYRRALSYLAARRLARATAPFRELAGRLGVTVKGSGSVVVVSGPGEAVGQLLGHDLVEHASEDKTFEL